MILNNPDIFPDEKILQNTLSESVYRLYYRLINTIIVDKKLNLSAEWRYYKDGKSWLCKVVNKKRTIFWLSVWEGYFKVSFYFTEKHKEGIASLPISESVKCQFNDDKSIGKLIPLTIDIYNEEQLADLIEIVKFRIIS